MSRSFFIALFLLLPFNLCLADDAGEMLKNMQANFNACNEEDADALLASCSLSMPNREGLRRESVRLFAEKDVHYSLVSFKLLGIEGDYAVAEIVQDTISKDRSSPSESIASFRNNTTLLPKAERVRYKAAFKREQGSWKGYVTLTDPVPCN
jgi:hypothetical protein